MFSSVLIANRGEIACRIMRTARALGVRAIAVHSDADAGAKFVREADAAVRIGPAEAAKSYLDPDAVLAAARATGAEAIHPGYGFLSENAGFAEAVEAAGLIWIGPPASAIRAMGLKDEAKRIAAEAGVPVLAGYSGLDQSPARLREEADRIGYPLLIKAVAGGGGRGIREVTSGEALPEQLASAQREASAAFRDDRVMLEKLVRRPRHIEVQVFADAHGNAVHLYERDCSLQRRRQKVVEEAPAPGMDAATRKAMTDAAVKLVRAVGYRGAGTVEFIVDGDGPLTPDSFWFLEMNTRLQVEHPVTEAVTGVDLVDWQFRVAAGEALPKTQPEIALCGWAMEARLCAERPEFDFRPAAGVAERFFVPEGAGLRLDAALDEGDAVGGDYDSMIAKVIAAGETREAARLRLRDALAGTEIWQLGHNAGFLAACLGDDDFIAGMVHTGLIAQKQAALTAPPSPALAAGLAGLILADLDHSATARAADPFDVRDGWRANAPALTRRAFEAGEAPVITGILDIGSPAPAVQIDGARAALSLLAHAPTGGRGGRIEAVFEGRSLDAGYRREGERVVLFLDGHAVGVGPAHPEAAAEALEAGDTVKAPMPGKVVAVKAAVGEKVAKGQTLVVLEAMKMEMAMAAPRDGVVASLPVSAGDQVQEGALLAALEAEEGGP